MPLAIFFSVTDRLTGIFFSIPFSIMKNDLFRKRELLRYKVEKVNFLNWNLFYDRALCNDILLKH